VKAQREIARSIATAAAAGLLFAATSQAHAKPLKVFILAGQSNMEGPASIETFDYLGDDPAAAPLLKRMRGPDGKPTVCDHTWISYLTGAGDDNFELTGKLTAGYGSMWGLDRTKPGNKIGPEFTFGLIMDSVFTEPVLIVKAAWGGKSLHTDLRPPSAGPYQLGAIEKKHEKVRQMRYFLDSKHKDHENADGKMTEEQKREYLKKFEADLISPAEGALWKRGASNAGYHHLGCAKTFALMGQAFAEATLEMIQTPLAR
jgi:hypothetical protein